MDLRLRPVVAQQLRFIQRVALQATIDELSTEELRSKIAEALVANPVLERVDDHGDPDTGERSRPQPAAPGPPDPPDPPDDDRPGLLFDPCGLRSLPGERSLVALEEPEEREFDGVVAPPPTLAEHLEEGLRLVVNDPGLLRLATEIIGNLDENGYLQDELDEIATRCGATAEDALRALEIVQGLDPPGVGARSLQECLLLQLWQRPTPPRVAVEMVERCWDDLLHARIDRIALQLGQPRARVEEALDEVGHLYTRPGRAYGSAEVHYARPDVAVREIDGEWVVLLEENGLPRLRPSRLYDAVLDGPPGDAQRWVRERLHAAQRFVQCVYRRQTTLRRVTESIFEVQRPFLDGGLACLRPLSLRHVADDVGVHESTISRLARRKYVDTPHGVFELRRFFTQAVPTRDGGRASVDSALSMVKAIVAEEDPAHPLSDAEIVGRLAGHGLVVKRRTVTKYREVLGIAQSNHRRRAAAMRRRSRAAGTLPPGSPPLVPPADRG